MYSNHIIFDAMHCLHGKSITFPMLRNVQDRSHFLFMDCTFPTTGNFYISQAFPYKVLGTISCTFPVASTHGVSFKFPDLSCIYKS